MNDKNFMNAAWKKIKELGLGFLQDIVHIVIALAIFMAIAFLLF